MSRANPLLFGSVLLCLPGAAVAAPFAGFSIELGAGSHAMAVEADSTTDDSTADDVDGEFGPALGLGIGARPSENVHLHIGVRGYAAELDTDVYSDDHVEVSDLRSVYGQIGYVLGGRNVIYGVFEAGRADTTVSKEDYDDVEFDDVDTFAFGVGYKRALDQMLEFFVEGMSRTYDDLAIDFEDGPNDGRTEYEIASANVTAGFAFRF